jgi:hypothetical protein
VSRTGGVEELIHLFPVHKAVGTGLACSDLNRETVHSSDETNTFEIKVTKDAWEQNERAATMSLWLDGS